MNNLFKTGKIGPIEIKNRIFMAPLTRSRATNEDFAPNELHSAYYSQRAGAGLIISEGTVVSPMGVGYKSVPGIYSDKQVEAWTKVTEAVHENGGKIFMQIWHVGRQSHPDYLNGKLPLAPSAINPAIEVHTPLGKKSSVTPKELSIEEINSTVDDFARAGKNAIEAGFDGIEIHSSNGYLFHQFFSSSSNHRTDLYGGSDENKTRFLFEVIDALKAFIPENRIGLRLNPMLNGMGGIKLDEQTAATFEYIIGKLNTYDLAYLHLSKPWFFGEESYIIKDVIGHFGKQYNGFVIANGNYDPESAESELASGNADAIAFGRPYISNPDLSERIKHGWPLASSNTATYYSPGPEGYIDYESYKP